MFYGGIKELNGYFHYIDHKYIYVCCPIEFKS